MARSTLNAISGRRAPTRTQPARGSSRTGPRSGDELAGVDSPLELARPTAAKQRRPDSGRDLAVQEDRKREVLADAVRERERGCFGDLELVGPHRDEGHDVRGADARVDTLVLSQVDSFARVGDPVDERLDELRLRSREREDRSVMVGINVDVEHMRMPLRARRRAQRSSPASGLRRSSERRRAGGPRTYCRRAWRTARSLDAPARQPALPRVRGGRVSARVAARLRRERRPPRLHLRPGARSRRGRRAAALARACGPRAPRLAARWTRTRSTRRSTARRSRVAIPAARRRDAVTARRRRASRNSARSGAKRSSACFGRGWSLRSAGSQRGELLGIRRLTEAIGERFELDGVTAIPLPHPSGASGWLNDPANRSAARSSGRARARRAL